jgi:hypothetical protein
LVAGLKVFEGTLLERVVKSYQAAQEKSVDEYGALSKCSAAFSMVVSLEKEAENGAANGMWTKSVLLRHYLSFPQVLFPSYLLA